MEKETINTHEELKEIKQKLFSKRVFIIKLLIILEFITMAIDIIYNIAFQNSDFSVISKDIIHSIFILTLLMYIFYTLKDNISLKVDLERANELYDIEIEKNKFVNTTRYNLFGKTAFVDDFINLMFIDKKVPFFIPKSLFNISYSMYHKLDYCINNGEMNRCDISKDIFKKDKFLLTLSKIYEYGMLYASLIKFNETGRREVANGTITLTITNGIVKDAKFVIDGMNGFEKEAITMDGPSFDNYYKDLLKSNTELKDISSISISLNK